MFDLEKIFKDLVGTLDQNLVSENKDFWGVYYALWRFLYSTNQNIEESSTCKDKIAVIESFIGKYKEVEQVEKALMERSKIKEKERVGSSDEIAFNSQILEMKALLMKEQERLGRLMKEVKKERLEESKPQNVLKKPSKKEKWLKT